VSSRLSRSGAAAAPEKRRRGGAASRAAEARSPTWDRNRSRWGPGRHSVPFPGPPSLLSVESATSSHEPHTAFPSPYERVDQRGMPSGPPF
jgi:hypothetical protein